MPRVLVAGFCAVPDANRAGVQIPHVLRALAERYAVEVLTVREGDRAYVEQYRKTRMLRVPVPRGSLRERLDAYRRALRRQLEGADYAAVHCCDSWSAAAALELRERLGFKLVYDVGRRPDPVLDATLEGERKRDDAVSTRAADLVLAPTRSAARYLAARTSRDVCLVPPGVDVDAFDWDVRAEGGAAEVLCVGPIRAGAGIELLLRAMVDVCARADARLRLLGRVAPDFERALFELIHRSGLGDRVAVDEPVGNEAVPRHIARATLCVAPSAPELARRPDALYPTRLLEYMACKRVAIAPRRGTVTALVGSGKHAALFAPDDATELAAQILRLLGDPALAERMAEAGYRLVREQHTASATRRALRQAYDRLEPAMPDFETDPRLALSPVGGPDLVYEITDSQLADSATADGFDDGFDDGFADGFDAAAIDPDGVDHTAPVAVPDPLAEATEGLATGEATAVSDMDGWVVESGPLRDETLRHVRPLSAASLGPASADVATAVEIDAVPEPATIAAQNQFAAGEVETPVALARSQRDDGTGFTAIGALLPALPADEPDPAAGQESGI